MINHCIKKQGSILRSFPWKHLELRKGCVWDSIDYCEKLYCVLLFHIPTDRMILEIRLIIIFAVLAFLDYLIFLLSVQRGKWSQAVVILQIVPVKYIIWRRLKSLICFNCFVLFHTKKMKWLNDFLFGFILANAIIESIEPINGISG